MANDSTQPRTEPPDHLKLDLSDKPKYQHDCDECIFMQHMHEHDVYFCKAHGVPTLIARKSSRPDDYRAIMLQAVIRGWVRIGV